MGVSWYIMIINSNLQNIKLELEFVLVETMARWIYKLIKLRGFLGQMGKFCPNFAKCLVNPRMP